VKIPLWRQLLRFWEGDRSLAVILGLLLILLFVWPALVTPAQSVDYLRDIAFSALLLAGATTAMKFSWLRLVVAVILGVALVVRWAAVAWPSEALLVGREASTLLLLSLFCLIVGARVYRDGPVTSHRIMGAVAVYLLLGLGWEQGYELLYMLRPESFAGVDANAGPDDWIYFSFVTLTTVGYGDITPVSPLARTLAIFEALTGQIYLVVMLARLVALQIATPASD
jgi:hypothetical protein